jgi:hypothetical protein
MRNRRDNSYKVSVFENNLLEAAVDALIECGSIPVENKDSTLYQLRDSKLVIAALNQIHDEERRNAKSQQQLQVKDTMKDKSQSLSLSQLLDMQAEIQEAILVAMDDELDDDLVLKKETADLVETMLNQKTDGVAVVIGQTIPAHIDYLKKMAAMYSEGAKRQQKALDRFKNYIQYVMQAEGVTKLSGMSQTISLVNSPPTVDMGSLDPKDFADSEFVTTIIEYKWDKSVLKASPDKLPEGATIKQGQHVRSTVKKL